MLSLVCIGLLRVKQVQRNKLGLGLGLGVFPDSGLSLLTILPCLICFLPLKCSDWGNQMIPGEKSEMQNELQHSLTPVPSFP